jgi:valyl-tRNA synthetase
LHLPLGDLVDIAQEIARLQEERNRLAGEIKRGESMLANPGFVNKAPEAKVAEERRKLAEYRDQFAAVESRLADLT